EINNVKNSNNNRKRSATVYYKNEEECANSAKYMIFYFNTRLSWANKKRKTIESRITETEEEKTPHDRVYKRKLNRDIWKTDLPETESSEDEVSDNENMIRKNQQKNAYSKQKRRKIREE